MWGPITTALVAFFYAEVGMGSLMRFFFKISPTTEKDALTAGVRRGYRILATVTEV